MGFFSRRPNAETLEILNRLAKESYAFLPAHLHDDELRYEEGVTLFIGDMAARAKLADTIGGLLEGTGFAEATSSGRTNIVKNLEYKIESLDEKSEDYTVTVVAVMVLNSLARADLLCRASDDFPKYKPLREMSKNLCAAVCGAVMACLPDAQALDIIRNGFPALFRMTMGDKLIKMLDEDW